MRDVLAAEVFIAVIEPVDLLVAFVVWLAIAGVVGALGWWLRGGVTDPQPDGKPAKAARARRQRPLRTGTIHTTGVHVPPDETVVIDTREVRR